MCWRSYFVFVEALIPICSVFGSNLSLNLFRKIFHVFFECLCVYFFSEIASRFRFRLPIHQQIKDEISNKNSELWMLEADDRQIEFVTVTNVTNSINEKFNASIQMTNRLFWIPKLRALFRSMCLVQGITTALPIVMIKLRTLEMCRDVRLGVC